MNLFFSHGKESGPWGFKIKRLAKIATAKGCGVDSIDYRDSMDPDLRVERLLARLQQETRPFILVGSSMGGYVSLVASASIQTHALFLIAPALYIPSFKQQQYASTAGHIEVVHGWSDDVIPPQNSIDYAREADCSLHLISGDHPLNTSIESVETLFERFLDSALATSSRTTRV
jgi:pimeloyl-ACP methyl ester carboxylesterase